MAKSASNLTDCVVGTLAEVWPDNIYNVNGPWLSELLELQAGPLVLDDLFALGGLETEPGYEVRCHDSLEVFAVELCMGPATFDFTNEAGTTPVSILATINVEISPEVDCFPEGQPIEEKVGFLETAVGNLWATGGTVAVPNDLEHLATAVN